MQAIHNELVLVELDAMLFQRAKIQDKCKQFTTVHGQTLTVAELFQRAKIQDKCKQFTTAFSFLG